MTLGGRKELGMDEKRPPLKVGDRVRVRAGSAIERARWEKRNLFGTVAAVQDIPAYGQGVKVQWPDEEVEPAFSEVGQYEIAEA